MKIIIDTHIFLWALSDSARISKSKRSALESLSNTIYVSSISVAEIMIKASFGKLEIDFDPVELAQQSGFELLNFTGSDALRLFDLPFHHKDPFDRMLIAQSLTNRYPIMTDDHQIRAYECQVI